MCRGNELKEIKKHASWMKRRNEGKLMKRMRNDGKGKMAGKHEK